MLAYIMVNEGAGRDMIFKKAACKVGIEPLHMPFPR